MDQRPWSGELKRKARSHREQECRKGVDLVSTEIDYFSGTGNSLHVAQELQKRLPGARLIPIMSFVGRESMTASGNTVGFVFPHYASSLPKVIRAGRLLEICCGCN